MDSGQYAVSSIGGGVDRPADRPPGGGREEPREQRDLGIYSTVGSVWRMRFGRISSA